MDIISIAIGIIGLIVAMFTHLRTKKTETFIRLHLAKLDGKIVRLKQSTESASDNFKKIRECLDPTIGSFNKEITSNLIHSGACEAASSYKASIELLRDLRGIQLSLFGKVEHLESSGKLITISKIEE